jgi:uncharacterized damage-inducible protein DinB
MPRQPWVDRRFTFDFPVDWFPDVLERLRGTPARIEDRVRGLDDRALAASDGPGWSIKRNVGHLLDLEPLWDGRVDDFLAGRPVLRAADITNRASNEADHDARPIGELLAAFRAARLAMAARAHRLDPSEFARVSVHPRLNQPMRLVDALAFVCMHDDYHLARIGELVALHAP